MLRGEPLQGLGHQRERPLTFEEAVRGFRVGGFVAVPFLGGVVVEGDDLLAAAPLEGGVPLVFVDEVVVQRGEQERSEPAALAGDAREVVAFEQSGEESLGQVLGGVGIVPSAADVGVEGKPVGLAKLFESQVAFAGRAIPGREDERPTGRCEGRRGSGLFSGHVRGRCHGEMPVPRTVLLLNHAG